MESLSKPIVEQSEYIREAWRLTNLEMFIGRNVVGEYMRSVNVQMELPYPHHLERLLSE
mgnify:CR=1 FL=1